MKDELKGFEFIRILPSMKKNNFTVPKKVILFFDDLDKFVAKRFSIEECIKKFEMSEYIIMGTVSYERENIVKEEYGTEIKFFFQNIVELEEITEDQCINFVKQYIDVENINVEEAMNKSLNKFEYDGTPCSVIKVIEFMKKFDKTPDCEKSKYSQEIKNVRYHKYDNGKQKFSIYLNERGDMNDIRFTVSTIGEGIIEMKNMYVKVEYFRYCCCKPHSQMIGAMTVPTNYEIMLRINQQRYPLLPLTPDDNKGEWVYRDRDSDLFGIIFLCQESVEFVVQINAEIYDHFKDKHLIVESGKFVISCGGDYVPSGKRHKPEDFVPNYPPFIYKMLITKKSDIPTFLTKIDRKIIEGHKENILRLLENDDRHIQLRAREIVKLLRLEEAISYVEVLDIISGEGRYCPHPNIGYWSDIGLRISKAAFHFNFGNLLKNHSKKYDEAEKEYRTAIGLFPLYPEAHNNLGCLLMTLKRYDESEDEFRKAIKIDPDYVYAHQNLGVLLKNLKRYDESEDEFEK